MTLTIELSPELEQRLQREADTLGMSAGDYARRVLERHLPPGEPRSHWETLKPEEWIRETRSWIEGHRGWPVLPPGADDRASFYEDRE